MSKRQILMSALLTLIFAAHMKEAHAGANSQQTPEESGTVEAPQATDFKAITTPEHTLVQERPLSRTWWPYMLGSLAAAGGGFFALQSAGFFGGSAIGGQESDEDYDLKIALGVLGISAFVVSGTLAVVGLTLHFTWGPEDTEAQGQLSPTILPGGGSGMSFSMSF